MTKKDKAELARLTKRILFHQKVTHKQVLRAIDLRQRLKFEQSIEAQIQAHNA